MGAKFGNFSISNISVKETVKLLESYPENLLAIDYLELGKKLLLNKLPAAEKSKFEESMVQANLAKRTFYIGIKGKWTTVYSEDFFVGDEINIIPLSRKCNNTFVVAEVYDGDVFGLAVIRKGVLQTRHVSGATDGWYMTAKKGDLDILAKTFGIPDKKKVLEVVLDCEDISDKIDALEELFDIRLWTVGIEEDMELGWKKVVIPPTKDKKTSSSKRIQVPVQQRSSPLAMAWDEFDSTPPWKYSAKVIWETEIKNAKGGELALSNKQELIVAYNYEEGGNHWKTKGRLAKIQNDKVTDYFEIDQVIGKPSLGDNGDIYVTIPGYFDAGKDRNSDSTLLRVRPDGTIVWKYQFDGVNIFTPVTYGDSVFINDFKSARGGSSLGHLNRINNDGELVWQVAFETFISSNPVILGDKGNECIILGLRLFKRLVEVDMLGNIIVEKQLTSGVNNEPRKPSGIEGPWLAGEDLFARIGEYLVGLDENLEPLWQYTPAKGFPHGAPVIDTQKNIYCYATANQLFSLDSEGKERWVIDSNGEGMLQPVLLASGDIFIPTQAPYAKHHKRGEVDANTLIQIFTPAGQKIFEYILPGYAFKVLLGKDNKLYIGLHLARFYPKEERTDHSIKIYCLDLSENV